MARTGSSGGGGGDGGGDGGGGDGGAAGGGDGGGVACLAGQVRMTTVLDLAWNFASPWCFLY